MHAFKSYKIQSFVVELIKDLTSYRYRLLFVIGLIFFLTINLYVLGQRSSIINNIPVLCYHNITNSLKGHSPSYTCEILVFEQYMKALYDSGFHAITPKQLTDYLFENCRIPDKPFVITFDDAHLEHFTIAIPILSRYDFKAVFFVPSYAINKKNYLSTELIRALADSGQIIGAHSFDHPDLRHLDSISLNNQISKPIIRLEKMTGKRIEYFAYPFGAWNDTVISELRRNGIKAAFQLGGQLSKEFPQYTINRMLVSGDWTATKLIKRMKNISQSSTKHLRMVIDLNNSSK